MDILSGEDPEFSNKRKFTVKALEDCEMLILKKEVSNFADE
jgi:hypothetical protein